VKKGEKTEIVDMGFMPIAGEEWVYEMAVNCMLEPRSEGVPTWRSDHIGERMMMKLPAQFKEIFAPQKALDEDIGRALATWAKGGTASPPTPATAAQEPAPDLVGQSANVAAPGAGTLSLPDKARAAAKQGRDALIGFCKARTPEERKAINAMKDELEALYPVA